MTKVYKKQIGGAHYKSMKIQPAQFINENNLPFAEGNAIKYLCRHKQKGQRKDLEKAIHYCQMAIDRDYPEKKDFLEEAEKEKKELEESYKESKRQTEERRSNDYSKLLEMWREEKKKRQEAEGELTIIKGIGNSSPEMSNLKKEIDILKEDLRIKDLEMGKMMDKINGKKGNFRS